MQARTQIQLPKRKRGVFPPPEHTPAPPSPMRQVRDEPQDNIVEQLKFRSERLGKKGEASLPRDRSAFAPAPRERIELGPVNRTRRRDFSGFGRHAEAGEAGLKSVVQDSVLGQNRHF